MCCLPSRPRTTHMAAAYGPVTCSTSTMAHIWFILYDLPACAGFDSALVVVDHLTRMAHFFPSTKDITIEETIQVALQGVYRLQGLPRVLVCDRIPRFVSAFWQPLWRCLGTNSNVSPSRHHETHGLGERFDSIIQQFLRAFTCYDGSDWVTWLPQPQFAYNASRALGIKHTAIEAS
jgi:hypothetical protein